jgi:hypothetical protein
MGVAGEMVVAGEWRMAGAAASRETCMAAHQDLSQDHAASWLLKTRPRPAPDEPLSVGKIRIFVLVYSYISARQPSQGTPDFRV